MTPELQHTLVAVALGVGLMLGFLSIVGIVMLAAWGVAWLAAWWGRLRQRGGQAEESE